MTVKVGDLIKSFDFPGRDDCYMTGRVVDIEGDFIYCETESVVFAGKPDAVFAPKFRAPKQGLCMFDDDADPRIVVLES